MAYKNLTSAILAGVFLFLCCGAFLFGLVASQDAELGEQQASAQYYRPYYNYNRRPAYPVRRPTYNNYHSQRPQRPAAAPSNANYRPAPAPAPTTAARPSSAAVTGTSCRSSNSYQQYGICWAADSQRLQISPSLTIENFVRFHKINLYDNVLYSTSYRQQLCDQSRRFNSVGILCITSASNHEDDDDCFYQRAGGTYTSAAKSCINNDCICVVGDPYESIAANTKAPNDPFDAPVFQPGYWPAWTTALNQDIQNTLAASGIYWRP
ncbi:uncharacterized protein LOC124205881 isoform X3 [Daphnia pulex]|uniref:uncharacterized protein LOC124205881 isoform X3 n=1 Tax=Daphnia pulex TaxID=6669 RepID=UPI001EDCCD02|nr:uncharacterized protein LOC124205881 isoform X3 [Daphnia pulex]